MAETPIPVRTCVGCRRRVPATELLRVVVRDSRLIPDPARRLPGRGASLHPTPECLRVADRRRAFPRALRRSDALDTGLLESHVRLAAEQTAPQSDRHPAGPPIESRTSSDDPPVKSHR